MTVRAASVADRAAVWELLEPVFRAGETYPIERDIGAEEALGYWFEEAREVFVFDDGAVLGTFYLKANQRGGGAHVCNFGFVTAAAARGRGVATEMLRAAEARAVVRGFRRVQFNFVVASNTGAIALWERHGYEVVGRLPGVFDHPMEGEVDALVMTKPLI